MWQEGSSVCRFWCEWGRRRCPLWTFPHAWRQPCSVAPHQTYLSGQNQFNLHKIRLICFFNCIVEVADLAQLFLMIKNIYGKTVKRFKNQYISFFLNYQFNYKTCNCNRSYIRMSFWIFAQKKPFVLEMQSFHIIQY